MFLHGSRKLATFQAYSMGNGETRSELQLASLIVILVYCEDPSMEDCRIGDWLSHPVLPSDLYKHLRET